MKPGRIEISEAQLILYQKGDITVRWPLRSLRKYGFDAELFSFECGRRCPTGPGVYAFRCRRAEALFNLLQECLQNSSGGPGNISMSSLDDQMNLGANAVVARPALNSGNLVNGSAGSHRQVSGGVDSAGYLEPISGGSSHHVRFPQALNSGSQAPPTLHSRNSSSQTPQAPLTLNSSSQTPQTLNSSSQTPQTLNSSSQTLDGSFQIPQNISASRNSTPDGTVRIYPPRSTGGDASVVWSTRALPSLPSSNSFDSTRTNHNYVNGDAERVVSASAHQSGFCVAHQYVNSSDLDHSPRSFSSQGWYNQNENTYVNSGVATLPSIPRSLSASAQPGNFHRAIKCVDINTNYAKLDDLLKQEQSAKRQKEEEEEDEEEHCYVNVKPEQQSQMTAVSATCKKCLVDKSMPSNHKTQRSTSATVPKSSVRPNSRSSRLYVNLRPSSSKSPTPDTREPQDPPKMHYAVLDLDQNSESQGGKGGTSSTVSKTHATSLSKVKNTVPSSPDRTREGYVQIDFDRTVALSNSANPCPLNDESVRKTRHNATTPRSSTSS